MTAFASCWGSLIVPAATQAAIVGVLCVVLLRITPRAPSWFRVGVLLVALLKFALPPIVDARTGVFSWVGRVEATTSPGHPERAAPGLGARLLVPPSSARAGNDASAETDPANAALSAARVGADERGVFADLGGSAWVRLGIALHAAIGLVFLGFWWRQARDLASIRTGARPADDALVARMSNVSRRIGAHAPFALLVSDAVDQPICFGVFRPTVVLPRHALREVSEVGRDAVLAHESLHLRHRDPLIHHVVSALAIVWWFHPVFWLVRRELVRAQEDRVDDGLLARRVLTPEHYCQSLLEIVDRSRSTAPALSMGALQHPLARRFRRLLDPNWKAKGTHPMSHALILAFVPLLTLPGAPLVAEPPASPRASPSAIDDGATLAAPAVNRGLTWLASQQRGDGHFSPAGHAISLRDDALALLAFLGAGNTPVHGPHREVVARGVAALSKSVDEGVARAGSVDLPMATLAIVEAFVLSGDERLKGSCERALDLLTAGHGGASDREEARGSEEAGEEAGETDRYDTDGAVAFWSVLAASSGRDAGLPRAPGDVADDLTSLVYRAQEKQGAEHLPRRPRSITAAALLAGYLTDHPVDEHVGSVTTLVEELLQGGVRGVGAEEDAHFIAYAAFQVGGDAWSRFHKEALPAIRDGQATEGDGAGSWGGGDPASRLRRTAMNTLTLEVFYRYARLSEVIKPAGGDRSGG